MGDSPKWVKSRRRRKKKKEIERERLKVDNNNAQYLSPEPIPCTSTRKVYKYAYCLHAIDFTNYTHSVPWKAISEKATSDVCHNLL